MEGQVSNNGGAKGVAVPKNNGMTPSLLNSFRVSAVIDRLSLHTRLHVAKDSVEFLNLCLSLARGIDFAIANNEVPNRVEELPSLLKQVCKWNKNETLLQGALMVLMISVKNACESGWFSDRDSEELRNLAAEIASIFCSVPDFKTEPSSYLSVISTIISRFYPRMRMGHMLVCLEAKPGYDAYVSDFQISKSLRSTPGENIRLFVAQKDNIETSSCLISPPKVNFLLNGKAVERRTNVFMDTGPQIPTTVRHFLKYGSNLLQAVGEFNGNYIIAVALMSEVLNPDPNGLKDYEQHGPAIVDSDPEIIEGLSRISLNCPISFKRIRTPVKGYSCKHIQCFDFDNYVDINSRRPSWRCPHCNQPVCFTDIRVDQKMVKILKEVGPKVTHILFSSDGSWKDAAEINDAAQDPDDKTPGSGEDESQHPVNVSSVNTPTDILDLTQTDDFMDSIFTHETEDRKLNPTASPSQPVTQTMVTNPHVAGTGGVNQNGPQVGDAFWSGVYLSTFGTGSSNVRSDAQTAGTSFPTLNSVTSAPYGGNQTFHGDALVTTSVSQNGTSLPNTLQLQQHQFRNPTINSEYGGRLSMPRHLTRTPTAVQALPVQVPTTSALPQTSSNSANPPIQNGTSTAPQASPVPPIIANSAIHPTPHRPHLAINNSQSSNRSWVNNRLPQAMSQSPGSMQSPASHLQPQGHARVSPDGVSNQQAHLLATTNRAIQMAVDPSRSASTYSINPDGRMMPSVGDQRLNATGVTPQPLTRVDNLYDPADQNWRPAGRMRGALTGQAYSEALNQFIIQPTQQAQAQATRPINNVTPHPALVPQSLQAFLGNKAAAPNSTSAGPVNRPEMR